MSNIRVTAGRFRSNTAVTVCKQHSLADVNAEVSSDGSRLGLCRVGLTQHHPASLHHTLAFPHLEYTRTEG